MAPQFDAAQKCDDRTTAGCAAATAPDTAEEEASIRVSSADAADVCASNEAIMREMR